MRIALHNLGSMAGGITGMAFLGQTGADPGLTILNCQSETEIEAFQPDFVIATTPALAKITDFPTYIVLTEPPGQLIESGSFFRNLLTFDGYLVNSLALVRFIRDLSFGVGYYDAEPACFEPGSIMAEAANWAKLIAYHERKLADRSAWRAAMEPAPPISVVVRCGGRDISVVKRAVDSIRRQSFGIFHVIFAKYREIDLGPITADSSGAIAGFEEFCIPGGGRAEMLFTGIACVASPYFSVLDDDDFWASDHMAGLFYAGRRENSDFDMAFAGVIGYDHAVKITENLNVNRHLSSFGYSAALTDAIDIIQAIAASGFVARRDLLTPDLLAIPAMRSAEDSVLISLLARRSKPVFSYRASLFYRFEASDGSQWATDPQRFDDEISFGLRVGLAYVPRWLGAPSVRLPSLVLGYAKARLLAGQAGWARRDPYEILNELAAQIPGEQAKQLASRLAAIETSTFWRMTAPLRRLVSLSRQRHN